MSDPQYPALHRAADQASASAQASFLLVTKATLLILIATSAASALPPGGPEYQRRIAFVTAALMLGALTTSVVQRVRRLDDQWFKCRAIAENAKSAAWFFAMRPVPLSSEDGAKYEDAFLREMAKIRERFGDQTTRLAAHDVRGDEITEWMRSTQLLPLEQKRIIFVEHRIRNQIEWYGRRAQVNAEREGSWSIGLILLECAAVGIALAQAWVSWSFSAPGVAATIASASLTWVQTKRFSDLANSYTVAAQDLKQLQVRVDRCTTPQEFLAFVADVEMAISREHSMWLGRRVG